MIFLFGPLPTISMVLSRRAELQTWVLGSNLDPYTSGRLTFIYFLKSIPTLTCALSNAKLLKIFHPSNFVVQQFGSVYPIFYKCIFNILQIYYSITLRTEFLSIAFLYNYKYYHDYVLGQKASEILRYFFSDFDSNLISDI